MRKLIILFLLSFNFFPVFAQSDWSLSSDKDGVKIYTGTVPDSKIKAVKVECELKSTLSQLVTVLLDINGSAEWIYHTKSVSIIKQVSPAELYYYSEINLPWPAENRDFVAHIKVSQNPETKVVTMDAPAVPGFVPVKASKVRIDHSKGRWIITPLPNNKVRVEYTLHVDPGGIIPAWMVNMFATEGPPQIFKKLKLQLEKPAYKNAVLPFIVN